MSDNDNVFYSPQEQLDRKMLQLTLALYNNPLLSRKSVDFIIETFDDFISNSLIPYFQEQLTVSLKPHIVQKNEHIVSKVTFVLETKKKLFQKYSTEHKRFKIYENKIAYIPPELYEIGQESLYTFDGHEVNVEKKPVFAAHISLPRSLQNALQVPGVYNQMKDYANKLSSDNSVLSNVIQGDLWMKKYAAMKKVKNVYPLFLYFDEFETGNALGSHSGEQKLGGSYVSLPCLPPHLSSKAKNVFVSSIFHSKHLKEFGNKAVFQKTIEDLNVLSRDGIDINVNNVVTKVYFQLVLILGDNLGLNAICGFNESFVANFFCRICSASREECREMVSEISNYIRNINTYDMQVKLNTPKLTGIKERCIFNDVDNFHIAENFSVDIMHDFNEGVVEYSLSKLLEKLISDKIISLSLLNSQIESFSYEENEKADKPRRLFFSEVQKKELRLKQSATEMMCLVRYLGLMIGQFIPPENQYWKLYLYLRKIVGILTSPNLKRGAIINLQELIEKHNRLYLNLFGKLKPKMHFLLHYVTLMLLNGPAVHYSTAMFERKNKYLKDMAISTSNTINLPLTIAVRHQLQFCYKNEFDTMLDTDIIPGPIKAKNAFIELKNLIINLDESVTVNTLKHVIILGYKFSLGAVILITADNNDGPIFGKVEEIFHCFNNNLNDIYFKLISFKTEYFHDYYHAYKVNQSSDKTAFALNIKNLPRFPPLTYVVQTGIGELIMSKFDIN